MGETWENTWENMGEDGREDGRRRWERRDTRSTQHTRALLWYACVLRQCPTTFPLPRTTLKIAPPSPLFRHHLLPSSYSLTFSRNITSLQMDIISRSMICPGVIALVSNLLSSCGSDSLRSDLTWEKEYVKGRRREEWVTLPFNCRVYVVCVMFIYVMCGVKDKPLW